MRDFERKHLIQFIKDNGVKNFFEIGTYKGETTNMVADVVDKVYTIDIEQHYNNLKKNVEFFMDDSLDFDFSKFYDKIDCVLIDGDHDYRYVRHDTLEAYQMVRSGGWVWWHDYDLSRMHIVKFVNRFAKGKGVKVSHEVGTKLARIKKK